MSIKVLILLVFFVAISGYISGVYSNSKNLRTAIKCCINDPAMRILSFILSILLAGTMVL